MSKEPSIVVFPSVFSLNKTDQLLSNITKILKIKDQKVTSIKKDDMVIKIDANDPVLASSAINLLFGIKQVSIAKVVENKFEKITQQIDQIATNLLLQGESFLVKVEGTARGYLAKDIEMAAIGRIIQNNQDKNIKPGTKDKHDKLLYTFLTKSHAYVCIFSDKGLGGIPNNYQKKQVLCCVYNELSAIAALEIIKQGFLVKLLICYNNDSMLQTIVKILNNIMPRILESKIEMTFFHVDIKDQNYGLIFDIATEILIKTAKQRKIKRISLAASPLIFSMDIIEETMSKVYKNALIPYIPLVGLDDDIFTSAKEIGLEKFLSKISSDIKWSKTNTSKIVKNALASKKKITVTVGPNNIHDILDSLGVEK